MAVGEFQDNFARSDDAHTSIYMARGIFRVNRALYWCEEPYNIV